MATCGTFFSEQFWKDLENDLPWPPPGRENSRLFLNIFYEVFPKSSIMMTRGGGWWSSLWSPWSPRPRLSHTLILLIFNLIRITKWILHETIRPTNEETTRDDNRGLKCFCGSNDVFLQHRNSSFSILIYIYWKY